MRSFVTRLLCAGFAMGAIATSAHAAENGQITYPVGLNTVLNGLLPPPGATQFYNYTQHYSANKFAGPDGRSVVPGFKLNAFADALRIVHTWQSGIGPFSVSSGAVLPIVHLDIRMPFGSDRRTAISDIVLEPLIIGYSNPSKTFFAFFNPAFAVPSGGYSVDRLANTGLNTYAFLPSVSATWFPHPGWEISTTAVLEFNSRNPATNYHSGAVAVLDYVVGYSLTDKLQLGLQGSFLKQFTDDTRDGVRVGGDGFRAQAAAIGPQLRYNFGPAAGLALKYQREFAVRNRPQGNRFWFQFSFAL